MNTQPGSYTVNVTATSGSINHNILLTVTVTSPPPKSSYALIVSYEGNVYKYYPNNTLTLIGQPVTSQLRDVAWKPDGSYALIIGDKAVLMKYDGSHLTIIPTGINTTINFLSLGWRPDGSYVLIGGSSGILLKYDGTTMTKVSTSYAVSFRGIAWNPTGSSALLVSYYGQIFQYQASTGQVTKLSSPTGQSPDAVAWNPNGSYALLGGDAGTVVKYNGATFQMLNTSSIITSTLTVRRITFNPPGSLALLVGDSGLAATYDGTSFKALPVLTSNILYSIGWSDNTTATIVGGAGTVLVYSNGTLTKPTNGSSSGYRGINWKP
jgi:hypothetical protein